VQQILKSPDIFSFADYNFRTVAVDTLKVPPDSDNKDVNTWYFEITLNLVPLIYFAILCQGVLWI
jgi:CCR4-NOT transcription complex subunit 1